MLNSWISLHRSEIDRLMALLHARVADNPVEVEDKTTDVLPSRSGVFPESKEEVTDIPLQDNGSGRHVISYKAINLSVGKHFPLFDLYY